MTDETDTNVTIDVVRESNFARYSADSSLVVNLGRDLELSFLTHGPRFNCKVEKSDDQEEVGGFQLEQVIVENSRIRLSPPSGIILALQILDELAETGRLNNDQLGTAFEDILETNTQAKEEKNKASEKTDDSKDD